MLFASDLKANRQKKTSVGQKFWGLHNVSHFGPGGLANGPQMVLISGLVLTTTPSGNRHQRAFSRWTGQTQPPTSALRARRSPSELRPGMPLSPSGRQAARHTMHYNTICRLCPDARRKNWTAAAPHPLAPRARPAARRRLTWAPRWSPPAGPARPARRRPRSSRPGP